MPRPIVIAHHLMWTGYGWWLPNDPRGSMSRTVACDVVAELGEPHHGRRKIQPASDTIREFYQRAEHVLKFSPKQFDKQDVEMIADGFAAAISEHRYTCYACAIMPDHVHLLIRKHKHKAEEMIERFQKTSRLRLRNSGAFNPDHPVWGGPGWKVFLDYPDAVRRTIGYIENNPLKWRLPRQQWPFIEEYDGWPLHPGHSPNSPYARRLRSRKRQ